MAESLTKYPLTPTELGQLVATGFDQPIRHWSELADGMYNAAFAVTLNDGRELVLKVAPPPTLRLLTHEVDLMRTEVSFYQLAGEVGVPVPDVVFVDFSRTVIESDYVFLSRVPGVALHTVRDTLTAPELARVDRQIGAAVAALHQVTGPAFGYPLRDSGSWHPTWRAAFGAMLDDLLADAERLDSTLPASPAEIGTAMRRHFDLLDDVTWPTLVHFDLWDGNVFVAPDPETGWRLTGFIDGERAFYGDPIAELCSLALFRPLDVDIFGELTPAGQRRLDLYTTYLYVIMAIEGATRGWHSPERVEFERWLNGHLERQLAKL